jgi:hypothetical protein
MVFFIRVRLHGTRIGENTYLGTYSFNGFKYIRTRRYAAVKYLIVMLIMSISEFLLGNWTILIEQYRTVKNNSSNEAD